MWATVCLRCRVVSARSSPDSGSSLVAVGQQCAEREGVGECEYDVMGVWVVREVVCWLVWVVSGNSAWSPQYSSEQVCVRIDHHSTRTCCVQRAGNV